MVLQYSNFGRTKALNACSLMAGECTFHSIQYSIWTLKEVADDISDLEYT